MLATTPTWCRSAAARLGASRGRAAGATTIWRCSRTACWAAAIARSADQVIGSDDLGEQHHAAHRDDDHASDGGERARGVAAVGGGSGCTGLASSDVVGHVVTLAFRRLTTRQPFTVRRGDLVVAAGRQRHAALEPALRQLQAMDDRAGAARPAGSARRRSDRQPPVDRPAARAASLDARQGGDDQHLAVGLQHVDRRLPAGAGGRAAAGWKSWRCSRSARASISSASPHIQSDGLRDCITASSNSASSLDQSRHIRGGSASPQAPDGPNRA